MRVAAFPRDASWIDRPDTRSPKKVHRESEFGTGVAACRSTIVLVTEHEILVEPGDPLCCRRCWPI